MFSPHKVENCCTYIRTQYLFLGIYSSKNINLYLSTVGIMIGTKGKLDVYILIFKIYFIYFWFLKEFHWILLELLLRVCVEILNLLIFEPVTLKGKNQSYLSNFNRKFAIKALYVLIRLASSSFSFTKRSGWGRIYGSPSYLEKRAKFWWDLQAKVVVGVQRM